MNQTTTATTAASDELVLDFTQIETYRDRCNSYLSKISSLYQDIKKKYQKLLTDNAYVGKYREPIQEAINAIQKRATLAERKKQTLLSKINADVMTIYLATAEQTKNISAKVSELEAAINSSNAEIGQLKQSNANAQVEISQLKQSNANAQAEISQLKQTAAAYSASEGATTNG